MNTNVRRLARRVSIVGAAIAVMGSGAFGAAVRGAGAEVPVTDVGVAISGPQTAVTNGLDALINSTLHNDGLLAANNGVMTVATGGKVDTALPLPGNCSVTPGTTDTVTCTYPTVPPQTTEPTVQIAVTTPSTGTSMVSTATATDSNPSIVVGDTDSSASWTTTLSKTAPCGSSCTEAFVPQGENVSRTGSDGINQNFKVPTNASWTGGGEEVTLSEVGTTGITCGGVPCDNFAAREMFSAANPSGTPDPTKPLVITVTYNGSGACNMLGDGDGAGTGAGGNPAGWKCPPIYGLKSPATSGNATQLAACSPSTSASPDPCLVSVTVSNVNTKGHDASTVTYVVNALQDLTLPLLGGNSSL